MEAIVWGIAGGSVAVLVNRARTLLRSAEGKQIEAGQPAPSLPSRFKSALHEGVASTKALFRQCKQESEADRIAVEEVRNPVSDIRILTPGWTRHSRRDR